MRDKIPVGAVMPEEQLQKFFRVRKDQHATPTASCPDQDRLSSLLEPGARDTEQALIKAHIADCTYCTARLASAVRSSSGAPGSAHRCASHKTDNRLRYLAMAAAVSVLAITPLWFRSGNNQPPNDNFEERSARKLLDAPALTYPIEGQTVDSARLTVHWTPVAGAIQYSVRIVDDFGRIVVNSYTDTSEYTVPANVLLAPDTGYYVKVDAYVMGDKAVSSHHIHFTISE